MLKRIKDWVIDLICRIFGCVPKAKYDALNEQYTDCLRQMSDMDSQTDRLHSKLTETTKLLEEAEKLTQQYEIEVGRLADMEEEVMDVNRQLVQLKNLEKIIQKYISRGFHEDTNFAFAKNMCIPGSSSVVSGVEENVEDGKYAVLIGRTVLDDAMTAELQNTVGYNSRMNKIIELLYRHGIFERMAKDLMKCRAIEYSIGYNEDCTAIELYWKVRAILPGNEFVVSEDITDYFADVPGLEDAEVIAE